VSRLFWRIPEGLRILPDGSWQVGDLPVAHPRTLRYLKRHLVFDDGHAFVVDGRQRIAIEVGGPAFVVTRLLVDHEESRAQAELDDGSYEAVGDGAIGMDARTGRFECVVKEGQARALLSRVAHQWLLDNIEEEHGGRFTLRAGGARLAIRA
jgi:hypothetical protein